MAPRKCCGVRCGGVPSCRGRETRRLVDQAPPGSSADAGRLVCYERERAGACARDDSSTSPPRFDAMHRVVNVGSVGQSGVRCNMRGSVMRCGQRELGSRGRGRSVRVRALRLIPAVSDMLCLVVVVVAVVIVDVYVSIGALCTMSSRRFDISLIARTFRSISGRNVERRAQRQACPGCIV